MKQKVKRAREELLAAKTKILHLQHILNTVKELVQDDKNKPSCPLCDAEDEKRAIRAVLNEAR